MKKTIALLICLVMCVSCLAGCAGKASLAYAGMSDEVMCYENAKQTGSINVKLDKAQIKLLVAALGGKFDEKMLSSDTAKFDYDIKYNIKDYAFEYDTTLTLGGDKYKFCGDFDKESMRIDVESIVNALKMVKVFNKDMQIPEEAFDKALATLKSEGYEAIEIPFVAGSADLLDQQIELIGRFNYTEMFKMFKDVDASKMIKLSGDKVLINATLAQCSDMIFEIVDVLKNDATILEKLNLGDMEEMKKALDDFSLALEQYKTFKDTKSAESLILNKFLNNTKFKSEAYRKDGKIISNETVTFGISSKPFATMTSTGAVENSEIAPELKLKNAKMVTMGYFTAKVLLNCGNVVKSASISWTDDISDAYMNFSDVEEKYITGVNTKYIMKDDRIYLPLREIVESFGYNVDWVDEKAIVDLNGQKIDMSGIVENDRTYVKVRDFEKLGAKVDYVNEDGYQIATIKF